MGDKEGHGKYTYATGSVYEGEWFANKIEGHGKQTWQDGKMYYGQWSANHMHGFGYYLYADKVKYDGQFNDDIKEGYGIYKWTDGRRYAGWWHKGKQHGFGTYLGSSDGQKEKNGLWEHGKRVKWLDESDQQLANQGKFDYLQYFKNKDENQNLPFAGYGFNKPDGWDEAMNDVRTLLGSPEE